MHYQLKFEIRTIYQCFLHTRQSLIVIIIIGSWNDFYHNWLKNIIITSPVNNGQGCFVFLEIFFHIIKNGNVNKIVMLRNLICLINIFFISTAVSINSTTVMQTYWTASLILFKKKAEKQLIFEITCFLPLLFLI